MAAKVTKRENNTVVYAKTTQKKPDTDGQAFKWWKASSKKDLCSELIATANFLRQNQNAIFRQAAIFCRLYGNYSIFNFLGSSLNKVQTPGSLPIDRPTMNVIKSSVDTLVSRLSQSKPNPVFLTDDGDYKARTLAKQMNNFINGELYQTDAHALGALVLRDAAVLGTGCLKIYEDSDKKIALERKLRTELLVDPNDAFYGFPRQLIEFRLVDKEVLKELYPENKSAISGADQGFPDSSTDSSQSIADQCIIVEAWHLPSGSGATDGRHSICCSTGTLLDEPYTKDYFPFAFLHYTPQLGGFWGQGIPEDLMGTQIEINRLLITMSKAINLVGVPRVFIEQGSKVLKAAFNNEIGSLITYMGTKPIYEVAPCVPQEMYAQLERLVQFAYQQCGISALSATSQKPAGLNSGEAIRSFDDLQSDRFAALNHRYNNFYIDLSYKIIDSAKEIALREGSYQTVYPNRNGVKEIDLPAAELLDDPFVIQCFDQSSLPREPAGRRAEITEWMQSGLLTPDEGRRLLDLPDLDQFNKLANAAEERILKTLDEIVEEGKYTPPDPFTDLAKAEELTTKYYNLYVQAGLEESRAEKLRTYFTQIQTLKQAAMPPPPPMGAPMPGQAPQAVPASRPVSDLMANVPPPQ